MPCTRGIGERQRHLVRVGDGWDLRGDRRGDDGVSGGQGVVGCEDDDAALLGVLPGGVEDTYENSVSYLLFPSGFGDLFGEKLPAILEDLNRRLAA